jgi:hypothetical protein
MAYMERDGFLETTTKLADVVCAKEAKGEVVVKKLRGRVTIAEALNKIKAIGAPRENSTMTAIASFLEDQGPVELEEEGYCFKCPSNALDVTKMVPYLVIEILHLVHIIDLWFFPH